tara:strand:- start:250 stop:486 length:237 start_codon:yes stop_codon:yes gene_type:complete
VFALKKYRGWVGYFLLILGNRKSYIWHDVAFFSMKERLSVTVEAELIRKLEKCLDGVTFRNKSHIVEMAVAKWLESQE